MLPHAGENLYLPQAEGGKMKIVTDSAADMTREDVKAHDISIAPLFIQFPEGGVSAEDISADDFYDRLRKMVPQVPTTSQPSAGAFMELYKNVSHAGEEVLSIHISSGLSGTIESARSAAQELHDRSITLVDTMTLSGGERFQVLAAALAVKAGWPKKALLERLDQIRAATEVVYTLETLEYLARGGRIGRVQALAGSLLKLKPIIRVDKADGKYSTVGKERTIQRSLEKIADHLVSSFPEKPPLWVTVLHGQFSDQAENMGQMLRQKLNIAKMETLRISPVLGVHTGPGIVGAAVIPMSLMEIS
jgi:DegV family protein with EDD domain